MVIWCAVLVGNIGTWMRDVGSGWLMTTLSASATAVAVVQVATTLPIFLLALPAGALADLVDRRRLLMTLCCVAALVPAAMGVATQLGWMTPALLIAGLMLAGACTAIAGPVQQSLTPRLVPRADLRSAIALNSMGLNVARAVGPALGGLVVVWAGPAWTFYLDALSYLAVALAYFWWKDAAERATPGAPEAFSAAMRAGLRYAVHAPALRRVTTRAMGFFVFASALWALLPLVAQRELGGDAAYFGILLACVGAGAVAGAIGLPALRRRASPEALLRTGTFACALVLTALSLLHDQWLAAAVMVLAGAGWITVLTTAAVAVQTQVPDWVRGRALAVYMTAFYGAMTLGSVAWGQLADASTVRVALQAAAGLGVLVLLFGWRRPIPTIEPDLTPSLHWPEPVWADGPAMADRGPVLVTVHYEIAAQDKEAFLAALHAFAAERRRDGAYAWGVFEDVARPGRYIEAFGLDSWADHERQHARVSRHDADLQAAVNRYHRGVEPPRVEHYVAPDRRGSW